MLIQARTAEAFYGMVRSGFSTEVADESSKK
jgi:hypothetical protein